MLRGLDVDVLALGDAPHELVHVEGLWRPVGEDPRRQLDRQLVDELAGFAFGQPLGERLEGGAQRALSVSRRQAAAPGNCRDDGVAVNRHTSSIAAKRAPHIP
jgi:hypothetical protein